MNHPTARTAAPRSDLGPVHDRLRGLLQPYRSRLHVASDSPTGMTLELPGHEGTPWGFAAGTRVGSRYVSFYLMGVYGAPELLDGAALAARPRR